MIPTTKDDVFDGVLTFYSQSSNLILMIYCQLSKNTELCDIYTSHEKVTKISYV